MACKTTVFVRNIKYESLSFSKFNRIEYLHDEFERSLRINKWIKCVQSHCELWRVLIDNGEINVFYRCFDYNRLTLVETCNKLWKHYFTLSAVYLPKGARNIHIFSGRNTNMFHFLLTCNVYNMAFNRMNIFCIPNDSCLNNQVEGIPYWHISDIRYSWFQLSIWKSK